MTFSKTTYQRTDKHAPRVVRDVFRRLCIINEVDYVVSPPLTKFYVQHARTAHGVWTVRVQGEGVDMRYEHYYGGKSIESGGSKQSISLSEYRGGPGYVILPEGTSLRLLTRTVWTHYEIALGEAARLGGRLVSASWWWRKTGRDLQDPKSLGNGGNDRNHAATS